MILLVKSKENGEIWVYKVEKGKVPQGIVRDVEFLKGRIYKSMEEKEEDLFVKFWDMFYWAFEKTNKMLDMHIKTLFSSLYCSGIDTSKEEIKQLLGGE